MPGKFYLKTRVDMQYCVKLRLQRGNI